ncbi:MAG: hypothetical protein AAGI88_25600, partial [Pseudomonadota bacterium]
ILVFGQWLGSVPRPGIYNSSIPSFDLTPAITLAKLLQLRIRGLRSRRVLKYASSRASQNPWAPSLQATPGEWTNNEPPNSTAALLHNSREFRILIENLSLAL